MPSLFENAVASIRMGVEDFRQQDPDRDVSAVRNFYAGLLLLAKEAIIRAAPHADPELVIASRLKPVPNGTGGIQLESVGHTTIDFQQIGQRAADFGVALDHKALKALNTIRNDMEHHYTSEPSAAIRAAISKGFPVAASMFRQLDEDPLKLLGDAWSVMLEVKEVYDQELREARATLEEVNWFSASLADARLVCSECGSELIEQIDVENQNQSLVELRCRTCGSEPKIADVIEQAIDELYGADAYLRAKETGEPGPVHSCPACSRETLVEDEDRCANCGEPLDYQSECGRCGAFISVDEYLGGADGGVCSYCNYVMDKVMRE